MKKFLLATVAVIALGTVSASAADISRRVVAPARTSTTVVEQSYNWTRPT
jgi:hypothetical protein